MDKEGAKAERGISVQPHRSTRSSDDVTLSR